MPSETLLKAWEQGLDQPAVNRALLLLTTTHPAWSTDVVLGMSLGERDRQLIELHRQMFGHSLSLSAHCSECDELLEWQSSTLELLAVPDPTVDDAHACGNSRVFVVDGYRIDYRLPTSEDIMLSLNAADPETTLLSRCVVSAVEAEHRVSALDLPAAVREAIEYELELADPLAVIHFDLQCPQCQNQWRAVFDIITFIWEELTRWAHQTLICVYRLASAYSWSETDILRLSPVRRQLYLEIAGL